MGIATGSVITFAAPGLAPIFQSSAQLVGAAEEPFYAGKPVNIIAGFAPGGTIDIRARLFARHLAKYLPGNPSIVVQNMVGAGGLVAANYTFSVDKPDGLTLLHFPSSTVMNTFLTTGATVKYDIRQVPIIWLGSDSWLTVLNPNTTGLRKAEELSKASMQFRVGGSGVSSLRSLRPKLALELFGVDHTWVNGYKGSSDLLLAFEKGEIHLFEDPQDGYQANIQPREKSGVATVLWQTGIIGTDESFTRSKLCRTCRPLPSAAQGKKKRRPLAGLESFGHPASISILSRPASGRPAGTDQDIERCVCEDDPGCGVSLRVRKSAGRASVCDKWKSSGSNRQRSGSKN